MTLNWRKYNHPRDIIITIDDNTPIRFVIELIRRLIGGTYDYIGTQPRGRNWIYYMEDAKILEQQINPECTGWAATEIHGDAVIVDPDVHQRIQNA